MMVKRKCYFRRSAVDRPFDKVTFEQRPHGRESRSHEHARHKENFVTGRENSQCRGHEMEEGLASCWDKEEESVARVE